MIGSNILRAIQKKLKRQEISVTYDQIRNKFQELGIQSSEPQPDEISLVVETIQNELSLKIVKQEPQMENSQMTVQQPPQQQNSLAVSQRECKMLVLEESETLGISLRSEQITDISNQVHGMNLDYDSARLEIVKIFTNFINQFVQDKTQKTATTYIELRNELEASLKRLDEFDQSCVVAFKNFVVDTNRKRKAESDQLLKQMREQFQSMGYDV